MKNVNYLIENRTLDLSACSTVPEAIAPPRTPVIIASILFKFCALFTEWFEDKIISRGLRIPVLSYLNRGDFYLWAGPARNTWAWIKARFFKRFLAKDKDDDIFLRPRGKTAVVFGEMFSLAET